MRRFGLAAMVAAFAFTGCTSSSTMEVLDINRPSMETTASVDAPTPRADVGQVRAVDAVPAVAQQAQSIPAPAEPVSPAAGQESGKEMMAFASPPPAKPSPAPKRSAPQVQEDRNAPEPSRDASDFWNDPVYSPKFRDAKPVKFSGASPKPFEVHGVDVSRWQGDINWKKLKSQGANFAFIKATDGGDHLDPMFAKNWKGAAEAGIPRGAYHFFYWCRSAEAQAKWFIRNVPKEKGALPPVIDVEWNHDSRCRQSLSRARVLEKMEFFMNALERHYGQRPIIYTAPDFYADNLKGAFRNHSFWLRSVKAHPSVVYPGREWAFWQYSGTGLSKGVEGKIDLNVFNGTEESWRRWLGQRVH